MSFKNNEALQIKNSKNKNSGWVCLIDSIIYLIIEIIINYKHKKELNEKDGYISHLAEIQKIKIELNENRFHNYEYSQQSRHSRLPDDPNYDESVIKPEKAIIEGQEENNIERINDENNKSYDNNIDKNINNNKGDEKEERIKIIRF